MIVSKTDCVSGDKQFCLIVDYRGSVAITIIFKYLLPTIQEVLDLLQRAKVSTTQNVEQGFHRSWVALGVQYDRAFRTCIKEYEYMSMPLGLQEAPNTFPAVMNNMFLLLNDRGVIVYLDDILEYTLT